VNTMKQLLMIAYYFPPLGGAGVQRSAKFAKYLARMGWEIRVIAAEPAPFEPLDSSLLTELDETTVQITRVPNHEPFRFWDRFPGGWRFRALLQEWFLFPDRMSGWLKPALDAAAQICSAYPDIPVFTTSAPYTGHLIGLELKRRYHCFWVADFRDEWTQNPYLKYPSPYHLSKHCRVEHAVLNSADVVISVTKQITDSFKQLAPNSPATFATIPNGFDPEDLKERQYHRKPYFLITHVGNLNQDRAKLIQPVIDVLQKLVRAGNVRETDLKVRFIGPGSYQTLQNKGLPFVEIVGSITHDAALDAMAESDLLVLAEANPAAFTGKIFEYLGLRRPILGVVPSESPAAELIRAASAGWVVDAANCTQLEQVLLEAYQAWLGGVVPVEHQLSVIESYNRQVQAEQLAAYITRGYSTHG
jgi:glycosyltransferase involved in cell wall biosynthesis